MRRRGFIGTTGLATISFAGAHVPLGILSAGAQARAPGDEHVWMAPSRVTLFQSFITVAEAKGWFREEGVNVKVQPGTGTAAAVQQVATGGTAFGMAAPVATCGPIADQDAPIVTIGQVAYRGFFEIASRADRPLRHPSDFQGKTIGILSVGGTTDLQLDAMSIAVGLDPTKVRKVVTGIGLTGLPLLMRGDVDGFFVFYESKTALERDRAPLHYLPGDDFAPMPGDALITGRAFADDPRNEQAIIRFLRAARRGVEYMQDERNFDDIVSVLKAYNPIEAQDVEKGRRILSVLRGYMQPPAGMKRLRMDEAAWARCIELLEKIDVIKKKGVPHARFFTNRFVDQA